MPFGMGFGELVLILIILLVIFGATKLPQLGDGLGKAIKNFKRASAAPGALDVTPARATGESDGVASSAGATKGNGAAAKVASPKPSVAKDR